MYLNKFKQIEEMAKIMNECCNRYDEQGNHIGNKCYVNSNTNKSNKNDRRKKGE